MSSGSGHFDNDAKTSLFLSFRLSVVVDLSSYVLTTYYWELAQHPSALTGLYYFFAELSTLSLKVISYYVSHEA